MSIKTAFDSRIVFFVWFSLIVMLVPASGFASSGQGEAEPMPEVFGTPESMHVSSAQGALATSISIVVSPGRRNMEPKVALSYSSSGGLGMLGLGWQLELGRVEKWRGDGVPAAVSNNSYSYSLVGAGGELLETGVGIYRAKTERAYREFSRDGDGWIMLNGEGFVHRFGSSPDSRIDGQRWLLDRVEDASGNTINYAYENFDGMVYPAEIRYTGFAPDGDPGPNRVVFDYETRPDVRSIYSGFVVDSKPLRELSARRLKSISVLAGGALARRYEFEYSPNPLNGLSMLTGIYLVGADNRSRIALRTMQYGTRTPGWGNASSSHSLPVDLADADGKNTGSRIVDINGDNFADVIDGTDKKVWLGDGQGGFTLNSQWSNSLVEANVVFIDENGADKGVRLIDVDSNGLPDLFIADPNRQQIWLNTGQEWQQDEDWTASLKKLKGPVRINPDFPPAAEECTPPHCDGEFGWFEGCTPAHCTGSGDDDDDCVPPECVDGKPEGCLPPECEYLPQYSGLGKESLRLVGVEGESQGVMLADANGDGRVDILWSMESRDGLYYMLNRQPISVRVVYLNTGTGWDRNPGLSAALHGIGHFVEDGHVNGYQMLDVNGDGLADIIRTGKRDQDIEERIVYLGTGHGWEKDTAYSQSLIDNDISSITYDTSTNPVTVLDRGLTPAELNDDGLVDYLMASDTETRAFRNTGLGWEEDPSLAEPFKVRDIVFVENEGTESAGVVFASIDGDGLVDVIRAKDGSRQIHYSSGMRSGLMVKTSSALGEVTTIGWGMSVALDNRDTAGIERLPFNMPVVRSLLQDYGHETSYTTAFDYAGGLFEARQFKGFRQSVESQPSGLEFHTTHYQTRELAGLPKSRLVYDSAGQLRERHLSEYDVVTSGPSIKQVLPVLTVQETIEGGETRRTIIEYSYNEFMNPVSVYKDPEEGVPGDEVLINTSWVVNKQAGIWSLPWRTTTFGPHGEVLKDSVFSYDKLPEGQVSRGLVSRVRDLVEGTTFVARTMEYDRYGNVIAFRNRTGELTRFEYDATSSFRTLAVDPEDRTVFSEYDPRFGREVTQVDGSGNRTTLRYDAFSRLAKITLPGDETAANGTRTYTYSPLGNPREQHYVLSETQTANNPETLDTKHYFDAMGNNYRVERKDSSGRTIVTTNEFDDKGNPIRMSLPFYAGEEPEVSVVTRDQLGRPVLIVDPDGHETSMTYAGRRIDLVSRGGETTTYWRNIEGKTIRISRWVDAEEQITRYAYDPLGHLVEITDALGNVTTIAFNALGKRTRLDDPNIGEYRYQYDDAGLLIAQVAPGDETTTFTYNRAGNLLQKRFPEGSTVTFHYGESGDANAVGRIIRIEDDAGVVDIKYDVRGNVTQRRREVNGTRFFTAYAYDSGGRLRRLTYPDGFVVDYDYNMLGDLEKVTDVEGHPIASGFEYNPSRQLLGITFGNQVRSSFSYGAMRQMESIETITGSGKVLQNLAYHYGPTGDIGKIVDGVSMQDQAFGYDEAGRLTRATGMYGERSYEYDVVGNLLRKNNMLFEMDSQHGQRAVKAHYMDDAQAVIEETIDIEYDLRGNVTSKSDQRFEYSAENRMIRMLDAKGKWLARNVYDAQGRRVIHQTRNENTIFIDGIYERGKTHDSRHVYAGPMLVSTIVTPRATVHLIDDVTPVFLSCDTPYSCSDWASLVKQYPVATGLGGAVCVLMIPLFIMPGGMRRRFRKELYETGSQIRQQPFHSLVIAIIAPVLLAVSITPAYAAQKQPLNPDGQTQSEKRYYYHSNHLGSVNVVTNGQGKVVERREYTPYGEPMGWTGPNSGPRELLMTFNGHRFDDDSGLYYFGARYYDAELGRFLTADTKVAEPMDPKTLNRYAFAKGNPIRFIDPTGHAAFDVVFGVLLFVAAVVILVLSVAITALSGGTFSWAGALGVAVAFALIGLATVVIGGLVALGFGIWYTVSAGGDFTWEGFRQAMFSGFLLGTVVTLGVVAAIVSLVPLSGFLVSVVGAILFGAIVGAGMGGLSSSIGHIIGGGGPDDLFWNLVSGIAWGALFGAVTGGAAELGGQVIGGILSQGKALAMFSDKAWNVIGVIAGLGALGVDVVDSFVLPFVGYGHSVGGFSQALLSQGAIIAALGGSMMFKWGLSNGGADVWRAFFGAESLVQYLDPQPLYQ